MAEEPGDDKPTEELKAQIAHTRALFSRDLSGLRYELDFLGKIRKSFRRQTVFWLAGAAAVGLLLTRLPARTKKVYVEPRIGGKSKHRLLEAGFVLGALKIAATLLRPVIVDLVKNRLSGFAGKKSPLPRKW
jgi:hypothetical protein